MISSFLDNTVEIIVLSSERVLHKQAIVNIGDILNCIGSGLL